MVKIQYEDWRPDSSSLDVIDQANAIVADYQGQGYDLTLRQLYYQFVARDLIPNTDRSYKRLGSILNRGRMAGYVDWDAIVDRTRNLRGLGHHDGPADIINTTIRAHNLDRWVDQPYRIEVWVEKEALAGVIQRAASAFDVNWFSCRGYVSQSELWGAAQRHGRYIHGGQRVLVLHLGDHDPSGIDMTRDIVDRLNTFILTDYENNGVLDQADRWSTESDMVEFLDGFGEDFAFGEDAITVKRIALNRDQIDAYGPPPNPAKLTDSRAGGYIAEHGRFSWELDALDPATLDQLIRDEIEAHMIEERYNERLDLQRTHRNQLREISNRFDEVVAYLGLES